MVRVFRHRKNNEGAEVYELLLGRFQRKPNRTSRNKVKVSVVQSCPTLCDLMDYILPSSSVHEIL